MENQKISLAVFDWAGTIVDYGCIAPLEVFYRCFEERGIHLTLDEIRKPMGLEKKDHIRTLLQTENASAQWKEQFGKDWTEADVDEIYGSFEDMLAKVVAEYSQVIPGVLETMEELRKRGIRIGSTTGYTREMMEIVTKETESHGLTVDSLVTPTETGIGRPSPFMLYENMRLAGIYPASRVVKIGDTAVDILEGKNAGAWTVGVLDGSSAAGMTLEERNSLPESEVKNHLEAARKIYAEAGADYIIDSISQLPQVIDEINKRMEE